MVILMGNRLKAIFNTFFKYIDISSEKSGKVVSLLALVLMLLVTIAVVCKNLNITHNWGIQVNRQVFGVFILFASAYAMLISRHMRVEIFYIRLSPRWQFYARLVDLAAFIFLMGVIIWQSGELALTSIALKEVTFGTPKIPLYIFKSFIPLVSILLLLQGISSFFRKKKPAEMLEAGSLVVNE